MLMLNVDFMWILIKSSSHGYQKKIPTRQLCVLTVSLRIEFFALDLIYGATDRYTVRCNSPVGRKDRLTVTDQEL